MPQVTEDFKKENKSSQTAKTSTISHKQVKKLRTTNFLHHFLT
jgi:hypothetical protein